MDFWTRLLGGSSATASSAPTPRSLAKGTSNNPQARLARYKRCFNDIVDLCNRPRDPGREVSLLADVAAAIDRLTTITREESRAPVSYHLCVQYAASAQIYTVIGRAAVVSHNEAVVNSAVAFYSALLDGDEDAFLSSRPFAKSLIRLATRVLDSGDWAVSGETETAILELLFVIAAKIRMLPEILPNWFQSTVKPELEDVFVREKKSFVGITQKADFPLCYIFIDRVHHEGRRIGDFARTGLLYIFEATGHSPELEEWIVYSDIPTLLASSLGALYSQLSRELSIAAPDAELPPILALSDYNTSHGRVTAESAYSTKHQSHMSTFLSYLAFWQDVLEYCKSADVKQTLLDHFQILFMQQLLYPSILQSSDTDGGSSVAVLTYLTAIFETLEQARLVDMLVSYLFALDRRHEIPTTLEDHEEKAPPRSPTALKRRQSLMLLAAPANSEDAVQPQIFNLLDLVVNSLNSPNQQTLFAVLKLISTLQKRHCQHALEALWRAKSAAAVQALGTPIASGDGQADEFRTSGGATQSFSSAKTIGQLDAETEGYFDLAIRLHNGNFPETAYKEICDDTRCEISAQFTQSSLKEQSGSIGRFALREEDRLQQALLEHLRTFFSNDVDINLALTEVLVALLSCVELQTASYSDPLQQKTDRSNESEPAERPWQIGLDEDELQSWTAVRKVLTESSEGNRLERNLYSILFHLANELDHVSTVVPDLSQHLVARERILQGLLSEDQTPESLSDRPRQLPSRSGSVQGRASSIASRSRYPTSEGARSTPLSRSHAGSPTPDHPRHNHNAFPASSSGGSGTARSIFQPPPPENEEGDDVAATTDALMQKITFPDVRKAKDQSEGEGVGTERAASLNHILTNVIVLRQFVLEILAILQLRAAMLGEREVQFTRP